MTNNLTLKADIDNINIMTGAEWRNEFFSSLDFLRDNNIPFTYKVILPAERQEPPARSFNYVMLTVPYDGSPYQFLLTVLGNCEFGTFSGSNLNDTADRVLFMTLRNGYILFENQEDVNYFMLLNKGFIPG
jgi:hypothetical protein